VLHNRLRRPLFGSFPACEAGEGAADCRLNLRVFLSEGCRLDGLFSYLFGNGKVLFQLLLSLGLPLVLALLLKLLVGLLPVLEGEVPLNVDLLDVQQGCIPSKLIPVLKPLPNLVELFRVCQCPLELLLVHPGTGSHLLKKTSELLSWLLVSGDELRVALQRNGL